MAQNKHHGGIFFLKHSAEFEFGRYSERRLVLAAIGATVSFVVSILLNFFN
jgi:hypothetical protein